MRAQVSESRPIQLRWICPADPLKLNSLPPIAALGQQARYRALLIGVPTFRSNLKLPRALRRLHRRWRCAGRHPRVRRRNKNPEPPARCAFLLVSLYTPTGKVAVDLPAPAHPMDQLVRNGL